MPALIPPSAPSGAGSQGLRAAFNKLMDTGSDEDMAPLRLPVQGPKFQIPGRMALKRAEAID